MRNLMMAVALTAVFTGTAQAQERQPQPSTDRAMAEINANAAVRDRVAKAGPRVQFHAQTAAVRGAADRIEAARARKAPTVAGRRRN